MSAIPDRNFNSNRDYYTLNGEWVDGDIKRNFKWKFNPDNPLSSVFSSKGIDQKLKSSKGDILREGSTYRVGSVQWFGVEGIKSNRLKNLIKKSYTRFEIDFFPENGCLNVKVRLKPLPTISLSKTALKPAGEYEDAQFSIIFAVKTIPDLVLYLRKEDKEKFLTNEMLENLATEWVENFSDFDNWKELALVFDVLSPELQSSVIQGLLKKCCNEDVILNEKCFERIQEFIHRIALNSLRLGAIQNVVIGLKELFHIVDLAIVYLNTQSATSITAVSALCCIADGLMLIRNLISESQNTIVLDESLSNVLINLCAKTFEFKNNSIDKFFLNNALYFLNEIYENSENSEIYNSNTLQFDLIKQLIKLEIDSSSRSSDSFLCIKFLYENVSTIPEYFYKLSFYILKGNSAQKFEILNKMLTQNYLSHILKSKFLICFIEFTNIIIQLYPDENLLIEKAFLFLKTIYNNCKSIVENIFKNYINHPYANVSNQSSLAIFELNLNITKKDSTKDICNDLYKLLSKLLPFSLNFIQIKENLVVDPVLGNDRPFIIDLHSTTSDLAEARVSVVELLSRSIFENKAKVILLLGEEGSGKTLFLKKYVLDYLTCYEPGMPIPFFVPLISLANPQHDLINEFLKKCHLNEAKEKLRAQPSIWFLDGFNELFVASKRKKINFFDSNSLKDWPNAQFVISCRQNFLRVGEDEGVFAPPDTTQLKHVSIGSCVDSDINLFLDQFVKTSNLSQGWDVGEYRKYITDYNLDEMAANPLSLRIIAETLPRVLGKVEPDELPYLLFDEWVAYKVSDECFRQRNFSNKMQFADRYLSFASRVSYLMELCQKQMVGRQDLNILIIGAQTTKKKYDEKQKKLQAKSNLKQIESEELSETIKFFKEKIDGAENAPQELLALLFEGSESANLRRTCFLWTNTKDEVQFIHSRLYNYFRALNSNEYDMMRLKGRIQEILDGPIKIGEDSQPKMVSGKGKEEDV